MSGPSLHKKVNSFIVPLSFESVTSRKNLVIIGESEPNLDLTHVVRIVPAMDGVGGATVPGDVPNAADGEEKRHDP